MANDRKLGLFEKVNIDWKRSTEMGELYQKLFLVRQAHKALSRGEMIRVPSDHDKDVYAFFRVAGKDKVFAVLNFSHDIQVARIVVPMKQLFAGLKKSTMEDVFTQERIQVGATAPDTVTVVLDSLDYRVFVPMR